MVFFIVVGVKLVDDVRERIHEINIESSEDLTPGLIIYIKIFFLGRSCVWDFICEVGVLHRGTTIT